LYYSNNAAYVVANFGHSAVKVIIKVMAYNSFIYALILAVGYIYIPTIRIYCEHVTNYYTIYTIILIICHYILIRSHCIDYMLLD